MRVIVCAKQIQYTYTRTGNNPDTTYINPEDSIFRVNPYDEAAIELALRLKKTSREIEISLLTLGEMIAEEQLRRCLAAGPDHLYRIDIDGYKADKPLFQPDPWVKADLISRAAKSLDSDLILCGKESMDRASSQVGALVAQQLNLPFVSAITDLSFDNETHLFKVQRTAGRGVREILECALPAVFSVGLGAELRLPTTEDRQRADTYEIRTPDIDHGTIPTKSVCKDIFQPKPRSRIIPVPDSTLNAFDRTLKLLTGSSIEKKGALLTGDTHSQVEGIINFLKENALIESKKKSI